MAITNVSIIDLFNKTIKTRPFEQFNMMMCDLDACDSTQKETLIKLLSNPKSVEYWGEYLDFVSKHHAERRIHLQVLINKCLETIDRNTNPDNRYFVNIHLLCAEQKQKPVDAIKYYQSNMWERGIGRRFASLYLSWSEAELRVNGISNALEVVQKGLRSNAEPRHLLLNKIQNLQISERNEEKEMFSASSIAPLNSFAIDINIPYSATSSQGLGNNNTVEHPLQASASPEIKVAPQTPSQYSNRSLSTKLISSQSKTKYLSTRMRPLGTLLGKCERQLSSSSSSSSSLNNNDNETPVPETPFREFSIPERNSSLIKTNKAGHSSLYSRYQVPNFEDIISPIEKNTTEEINKESTENLLNVSIVNEKGSLDSNKESTSQKSSDIDSMEQQSSSKSNKKLKMYMDDTIKNFNPSTWKKQSSNKGISLQTPVPKRKLDEAMEFLPFEEDVTPLDSTNFKFNNHRNTLSKPTGADSLASTMMGSRNREEVNSSENMKDYETRNSQQNRLKRDHYLDEGNNKKITNDVISNNLGLEKSDQARYKRKRVSFCQQDTGDGCYIKQPSMSHVPFSDFQSLEIDPNDCQLPDKIAKESNSLIHFSISEKSIQNEPSSQFVEQNTQQSNLSQNSSDSDNSTKNLKINSRKTSPKINEDIVKPIESNSPWKSFSFLQKEESVVEVNQKAYLKLSLLGKGGSSSVYRVLSSNGDIFAYKRVDIKGCAEDEMEDVIANYQNEIQLLVKLKGSPYIIELIDYEVNREELYIAMVMEAGEIDLSKVISQQKKDYDNQQLKYQKDYSPPNPNHSTDQTNAITKISSDINERQSSVLNPFFVRLIWQEMLQAVQYIHEHRIVHGDLKPANFVFVKGHLKLIDFGIAKAFSNETTNIYRNSHIGTINYMAPEAITPLSENDSSSYNSPAASKVMKLGRASDIWSLGCILYQMIYGKAPFASLNTIQKLHAIPNSKYEIKYSKNFEYFYSTSSGNVEKGLANYDPCAIETIQACLQRDPTSRSPIEGDKGLLNFAFLQSSCTASLHSDRENKRIAQDSHQPDNSISTRSVSNPSSHWHPQTPMLRPVGQSSFSGIFDSAPLASATPASKIVIFDENIQDHPAGKSIKKSNKTPNKRSNKERTTPLSTRKESLNVQRGEGFDLDSSFKNGKNGKILETISDSSYLKFPDKENDLRSLLEKKFDFMRRPSDLDSQLGKRETNDLILPTFQ